MGMLDRLRRGRASRAAPSSSTQLFDDDFQRRLETLAIVSRRVFAGRVRAERRTKKKGSGLEFADHRDYVPGDDFRFVDVGIYQRFGRLLVRLYEEEEDLSIYLLIDCSRSMAFGNGKKFDQARRLVAALAYVGLANLDRVSVLGVGDRVEARLPATRGKARIFKVLTFLKGLEATSGTALGESLKTFAAQHKRRGLAVVVSDLYDPAGFEHGINVLRHSGFEPYVLHVVDPDEAAPPLQGDLRVVDCETGEEREVTVTARLLDRLRAEYAAHGAAIEAFCVRSQVPYFRADVDTPFDELVLGVFRRGGFLR
jgi:uncharacterized protein (DUF58 family)